MNQSPSVEKGIARAERFVVFRRVVRNPLGLISGVVLVIVAFVAIFAPWLAPYDPNFADLRDAFAAPSPEHILGTDSAGRDVLSRLIVGATVTMLAASVAAGVAVAIGLPSGLLAGYYGGWFDTFAGWSANFFMALPSLIVLLAVRAAVGPSVWIGMAVFGVLIAPGYFRLTRTAVQLVRNEPYVDAARIAGLSDGRIIGRHILSVARAPIVIHTAIVCGIAIAIQAALEFLGLGDPLIPTWGAMLSEAFANIHRSPFLTLWPALAISLTIGSFVVLGNAIRDALEDPEHPVGARKAKTDRNIPGEVVVASQDVLALLRDEAAGVDGASDDPSPMLVTSDVDIADEEPVFARQSAMQLAVPPGDHVLAVRDLRIEYPIASGATSTVVSDVSLYVDRGEVLGLVGESGSGKTQTAFAVLGLLPAQALLTGGTVEYGGVALVSNDNPILRSSAPGRAAAQRIGYIPQEPMTNLDPNFTIGHQLVRPMVKVLGVKKRAAKARALELLDLVGIVNPQRVFNARSFELSGGMAQRVLIAGAVSCEPQLLIADEPTTALDVTVQAEVLDLLRDLQSGLGMSMVLVTHNFGVVADLCDRVAVMQRGRIVEQGQVRKTLRSPQHPYTKSLLAAMLVGRSGHIDEDEGVTADA